MGKRGTRYTAAQFIEAIRGTGPYAKAKKITSCMGIISKVADRVGCSWHTAKKYCTRESTPLITVADAFEEEAERGLDLAESQMYNEITKGDGPMIRYLLSTKGKKRGYTERHEIDLRNLDLSHLNESQLERIANGEDVLRVLATSSKG